ncbi:hypothetical protein EG240_05830 [Paenimyroides tangerinum]|uniref:Uncharacterized protein n=1 Tax=Paenimyroides tangerinum TaxID=2488728 RepID=A0A3P3W9Y6_9FLAO|nr:hypothetical protein [Paenimyroides tangerinum]RRJ91524.1 hypothetical protein EG240_05830 [Paenimyroides tangerinum]
MYSESSKILISKRVGWSVPTDSLFSVEISEDNQTATSGRYVNSFHQLATVENLFFTIDENKTGESEFNKTLYSMLKEASIEVLNKVLDQHKDYDFDKDYDSEIEKYQSLFDEPLGYLLAIKSIELLVSSNRSNAVERNSKLSFQMLKMELEGVKNDNGHCISEGLNSKFYTALKNAQKKIFPKQIEIIGDSVW